MQPHNYCVRCILFLLATTSLVEANGDSPTCNSQHYFKGVDTLHLQYIFYGIVAELDCDGTCSYAVDKGLKEFPRDMLEFVEWAQNLACNETALPYYEYLEASIPPIDAEDEYIKLRIMYNVYWSLKAKAAMPWDVPEELFMEYVLPYAVVTERRVGPRAMLYRAFKDYVKGGTITQAVQWFSQFLWTTFRIDASPEDPSNPPFDAWRVLDARHVLHSRHCFPTSCSITMIEALRAVGIPARLVGVAGWAGEDGQSSSGSGSGSGSYSWVEVWDGAWHFTSAHNYTDGRLDVAWFYPQQVAKAVAGSPNYGIWAAKWTQDSRTKSTDFFPMGWNPKDESVPAIDRTLAYQPWQQATDRNVAPGSAAQSIEGHTEWHIVGQAPDGGLDYTWMQKAQQAWHQLAGGAKCYVDEMK